MLKELFLRLLTLFIFDSTKRKEFRFKHLAKYNNKVILIKKDGTKVYNPKIKGLKVKFRGKNSCMEIHEPTFFHNCEFILTDNDYISIDETKYWIRNVTTLRPMVHDCKIIIGKNICTGGIIFAMFGEPYITVKIGDNCLISEGTWILPSDDHTMYDKDHNVLNKGQDVTIGNHVWVANRVAILKGANVPDNSIIGNRSVFTKSSVKNYVPEREDLGAVFVGSPAKMVKNGITWGIENPTDLIPW